MPVKVVIADQQEVVRTGLVSIFNDSPIEVVGETVSARGLLQQIGKHKPDLVLMDILLRDGDGLKVIERIRCKWPETRVVVFSTYDNPTYIARSYAWGAADYLLKRFSRAELIVAITQVAEGKAPTKVGVMREVASAMCSSRLNGGPFDVPLTLRETQVLRHLGFGLSNREIGLSIDISVETVKEHVQNVLRKLGLHDRTQAAVWAVRNGIV